MNQAIPIDAEELARLRASHAELVEALNSLMNHQGDRTSSNCHGGLGAACDQARAALANAANVTAAAEDAARMAAGFGEALELTRKAVKP